MPLSDSTCDPQCQLFEGGYYSFNYNGTVFGVAKILKLEPDKVHIRVYKQIFSQRPQAIDPAILTLGTTIMDRDNMGIGHLALYIETFLRRQPVFLTHAEVKPDELDGYNQWQKYNGNVFE